MKTLQRPTLRPSAVPMSLVLPAEARTKTSWRWLGRGRRRCRTPSSVNQEVIAPTTKGGHGLVPDRARLLDRTGPARQKLGQDRGTCTAWSGLTPWSPCAACGVCVPHRSPLLSCVCSACPLHPISPNSNSCDVCQPRLKLKQGRRQ